MIKTILWDFDGVILDSMKIKADGFLELFKRFDNNCLTEIEKYHYENGGVSRFDKIRYFYNNILGNEISEEYILVLADNFATMIEKKLSDKKNLIKDTLDFLQINYKKYNFHIVSGAEHNELNTLCDNFNLVKYFISIDGSPVQKKILVKNVLEKYNYKKEDCILIGDAMTDYNAAIENGITFYGYNNTKLRKFNYIDSFKEFIV